MNETNLPPLDRWIAEKYHIKMTDRFELEKWQLARFNQVLCDARERSSYYARALREVKLLRGMEDIAWIPFTDANILQKQGHGMLCVSQGEVARVVTLDTSGTAGQPKRIFFTEADQELTVDFFHHGMSVLTGRGEKAFLALPCASEGSVGDLLAKGLLRLGVSPLRFGMIGDLEHAAQMLRDNQPQICIGVPVQMLALAEYCESHRIHTGVERVLLSTDYAPRTLIARLEALWNCKVFNHYGMTEMGLGGAVECGAHAGMHIRENDLYVEVIDPESGEVLPEGVQGELVFTTLTRTAMPLIRYRTGDLGMLTTQKCGCKSILKRVCYVGERLSGFGIQSIDEAVFAVPGIVDYTITSRAAESLEQSVVLSMTVYYMGRDHVSGSYMREQIQSLPIWKELPFHLPGGMPEIRSEQVGQWFPPYQGKRRIHHR